MALTAVEKIIGRHTDRVVKAGDIVIATVDVVMAQDGNAPLAIRLFRERLCGEKTFDANKVILVIDHCAPSPNEGAANMQRLMRSFATEAGALLYDVGEGISHVVLPEKGHIQPGGIVVGSDSHTVTYGALNCLGTGMGATDIAVAMYTGKALLRVPETISVKLIGRLSSIVTAKDLSLHIVRLIGVNGATYKCLEISGSGLASLKMDHRFTICNMVVEMGGKCALMPVDTLCYEYLSARQGNIPEMVWSDPDAQYAATYTINLAEVEPLVVLPHELTNIVPARNVKQHIDIAFIGTCTNGRLSDLQAAAEVLRCGKVHQGVRLIVTPGSRNVYLEALRLGLIEIFINAGGLVTTPGCGPCVGTHQGVPGDGEVVISTANRNFRGRMGNANASIILASPATVAASAIMGRVAIESEVG